jgi:hypothetical protein
VVKEKHNTAIVVKAAKVIHYLNVNMVNEIAVIWTQKQKHSSRSIWKIRRSRRVKEIRRSNKGMMEQ